MATTATSSMVFKAPPTPKEFMIGWICVLKEEYRAAVSILDERYNTANLVRGEGDKNQYVLGRVRSHNVIINFPPTGLNGPVHAFGVARDMKSTFPRIRFALLVGIAGGVPSRKEDIRLGDVVLGQRVVPYRTGKETQNGFKRTGRIRTPPPELLTAVRYLDDRIDMDGLDLSVSIEKIRTKAARGGAAFIRPVGDRLYELGFAHKDFGCDCLELESQHPENVVHRQGRKDDLVRLFHGEIGADAAVMKNSRQRDAIAKREDILCYEMESWAVMNLIPCLPIRGISDYADEHKNDAWHLYASLAAATCAREFLLALPPSVVSQFPLTIQGQELERYMKGATSNPEAFVGSGMEKLRQTRNSLMERYEILRGLLKDPQDSRLAFENDEGGAQEQVQKLKNLQEILKHHLTELDGIMDYSDELRLSADPTVRAEFLKLKNQVQSDKKVMGDLGNFAQNGLGATGQMMEKVGIALSIETMSAAGIVMKAIGEYLGQVMKICISNNITPAGLWNWGQRKYRNYRAIRPEPSSNLDEMEGGIFLA